ncbi:MAG: SRPBCC domain-containing protein [bacterium]
MENINKKELTITRIFKAPCELVWRYWTEPEYFKKWWGPRFFSSPTCRIDFKVGGKYLHCMKDQSGKKFWNTGIYKEIIPFKKIVASDSFSDEKGNIIPASQHGMEGFPLELEIVVMFEKQDEKTKMTLIHSGIEHIDSKSRKNMQQGWRESFDKLAENLK